jgi:hypothetical protein
MSNYLGVQAQTRGGVFGPGGYGGGIFDGSGMGFGGLGDAAPAGISGFGSGLGQSCSIPSTCTYVRNVYSGDVSASLSKDIAEYCNQGFWEDTAEWQARKSATLAACQNVYNLNVGEPEPVVTEPGIDMPEEYQAFVEEQAPSTGPAYTAPTRTRTYTQYPWNSYSSATKTLQISTNAKLRERNQAPISEDGILGPTTCGAVRYVGLAVPSTCTSFSYSPTAAAPSPEVTPVTVPVAPTPTPARAAPPPVVAPTPMKAGMSGATMGIIGIAVIGIGAGIFAATRKKKS